MKVTKKRTQFKANSCLEIGFNKWKKQSTRGFSAPNRSPKINVAFGVLLRAGSMSEVPEMKHLKADT